MDDCWIPIWNMWNIPLPQHLRFDSGTGYWKYLWENELGTVPVPFIFLMLISVSVVLFSSAHSVPSKLPTASAVKQIFFYILFRGSEMELRMLNINIALKSNIEDFGCDSAIFFLFYSQTVVRIGQFLIYYSEQLTTEFHHNSSSRQYLRNVMKSKHLQNLRSCIIKHGLLVIHHCTSHDIISFVLSGLTFLCCSVCIFQTFLPYL